MGYLYLLRRDGREECDAGIEVVNISTLADLIKIGSEWVSKDG